MKTCTLCKQTKSDDEFVWRNKAKGTKTSRCKTCLAAKSREHYQTNKPTYLAKAKKWDEKNLQKNYIQLLKYFSNNPCVDCGNSNPLVLEFDHIDRKDKKFNVSDKLRTMPWATLLLEIQKCNVRCANCHKIRTNTQLNFWKTRLFGDNG